MLIAVVALVLFQGLGRDSQPDDGVGGSGSPSASEASSPPTSTDEGFCDRYRDLADAQAQYLASGGSAEDTLRDAAHALVEGGVPESMSTVQRTGYYAEIAGVYESIGDELDRSAVPGALEDDGSGTSLSGAAGEFGSWLAQYCPA